MKTVAMRKKSVMTVSIPPPLKKDRDVSHNATKAAPPRPLSLGGTNFPRKAHPENCNRLPGKERDVILNARAVAHREKLRCKHHARHYCWLQSCFTPPPAASSACTPRGDARSEEKVVHPGAMLMSAVLTLRTISPSKNLIP